MAAVTGFESPIGGSAETEPSLVVLRRRLKTVSLLRLQLPVLRLETSTGDQFHLSIENWKALGRPGPNDWLEFQLKPYKPGRSYEPG